MKLDPRQYDPRRIIREALLESPEGESSPVAAEQPVVMESAYQKRKRLLAEGKPAPFDPDIT